MLMFSKTDFTDFSFYFAALNVNNKGQEVIKAISQERGAGATTKK